MVLSSRIDLYYFTSGSRDRFGTCVSFKMLASPTCTQLHRLLRFGGRMKFKFSIPPHAGNARATIRSQLGPCPFSPGSSFRLAGAGLLPRRPLHTGIPAALAGTSSLLDRPDDVSEPAKLPSVRMLVLLEVGGMTCAGCTTAVRRTLADAFGEENVSVNFANATAAVEVDAPPIGTWRSTPKCRRRPRRSSPRAATRARCLFPDIDHGELLLRSFLVRSPHSHVPHIPSPLPEFATDKGPPFRAPTDDHGGPDQPLRLSCPLPPSP